MAKTQADILELVRAQPKATVFYKSFLELDGANVVSVLAFDSRAMRALLDEPQNDFQTEFPLFYKNKFSRPSGKHFYRSAIDSALRNNQIRAVSSILGYVVRFQNDYVSSFLFTRNLGDLMTKGVPIAPLLDSNIFCHNFDFDEWPSTHPNHQTYMEPYNGSIFELRTSYNSIYKDPEL